MTSTKTSSAKKAYLLLFLPPLFWAGNVVLARGIVELIPPATMSFWRWTIALLLLAPFTWKYVRRDWSLAIKGWKVLTLTAFFGIAGFNLILYTAVHTTTALNCALMQAAMPAAIILVSFLINRERILRRQALGTGLCMVGALYIVLRGQFGTLIELRFADGDLLMLLGIFFYALYTVLVRKRPAIHPLSFLTIIIAVGVLILLPLYLLEMQFTAPLTLNREVFLSIGYVAVFPSILAYLCWNYGIEQLGANRAGLYVNLVPLFASVMAVVLLGETFQSYHVLGVLFIFGGIALFNLSRPVATTSVNQEKHMSLINNNNFQAILFDLDGTLLQVEMHEYIPTYAASLADRLSDHADPDKSVEAIFSAISGLINRDYGRTSNETYFLQHIADHLNLDVELVADRFHEFFSGDLSFLDPLMQPLSLARPLIEQSLERNLTVVIATNPVFPRAVVEARLARAGLSEYNFHLVTCYENSRRCKPNPGYFTDILTHLNLQAEECLMVGNDSRHDLAARDVGIPTFLVDTWLIDRCQGDFTADLRGDHSFLLDFIMTIDKQR